MKNNVFNRDYEIDISQEFIDGCNEAVANLRKSIEYLNNLEYYEIDEINEARTELIHRLVEAMIFAQSHLDELKSGTTMYIGGKAYDWGSNLSITH